METVESLNTDESKTLHNEVEKDDAECPQIADITADTLDLPYDKKLYILEKDMETLYEFAVNKGFSSQQIRSCLSPILGAKRSYGKRILHDSSKSLFIISIIVAVIGIIWAVPSSKKIITAHLKLASIKTIPFWDWTSLYFEDCLIYNPYLPPVKNLTKEDCHGCQGYKKFNSIKRLANVTARVITDKYLYADRPFIVSDADKDWPKDADGEIVFNLDKLSELFEEHPVLTEAAADCEFFSTMEEVDKISQFSMALINGTLPDKFHVSWENCDSKAAKVFRLLTSRPYFIPPMAELSMHNQLVVSKGNFEGDLFELPQQIDSASWMVSLHGEFEISLKPNEECLKFKCKGTSFVLKEGEAVVVPSRLWDMSYTPLLDSYSFAFASTLLWDEVI